MLLKCQFFWRRFGYIHSAEIFSIDIIYFNIPQPPLNLGLAVGSYLVGHILRADVTPSHFLRRANTLQELCSMKYGYEQQFKSEVGYMKAKT